MWYMLQFCCIKIGKVAVEDFWKGLDNISIYSLSQSYQSGRHCKKKTAVEFHDWLKAGDTFKETNNVSKFSQVSVTHITLLPKVIYLGLTVLQLLLNEHRGCFFRWIFIYLILAGLTG